MPVCILPVIGLAKLAGALFFSFLPFLFILHAGLILPVTG
jgi:hypothetical protein